MGRSWRRWRKRAPASRGCSNEFKVKNQSGWMMLEAFSVSHGKASAYLPVLAAIKHSPALLEGGGVEFAELGEFIRQTFVFRP
jgi:hypothetical protein